MVSEEKEVELSVEEMKNAVAMSNFLPELLNIIQEMNNRIARMDDNLTKQSNYLNSFSKTVGEYIIKVDTLASRIENNENNKKELIELKNDIDNLKSILLKTIQGNKDLKGVMAVKPEPIGNKIGKQGNGSQEAKKVYTQADWEYYNIFSRILKDTNGKKTFLLTPIYVKTTYKCSESISDRIVKFYQNYGCFKNNMANALPNDVLHKLLLEMKACDEAKKTGKLKK